MTENQKLDLKIEKQTKLAGYYATNLSLYLEELKEVQDQLKKENRDYIIEMYKTKEKNIKKTIKDLDQNFKKELMEI